MADDALTTNGKNRLGKSLSDVVSTAGFYLGKKKKAVESFLEENQHRWIT